MGCKHSQEVYQTEWKMSRLFAKCHWLTAGKVIFLSLFTPKTQDNCVNAAELQSETSQTEMNRLGCFYFSGWRKHKTIHRVNGNKFTDISKFSVLNNTVSCKQHSWRSPDVWLLKQPLMLLRNSKTESIPSWNAEASWWHFCKLQWSISATVSLEEI